MKSPITLYRLGSELRPDQQRQVLAQYVHRFTGDHRPAWAGRPWKDGQPYPLQFANDREWLANTYFAITGGGELDGRARYCHSTPTWPSNPELRR